MNNTAKMAPEQLAPSDTMQETHERKVASFAEAKELLESGDPWHALPKKAEALGLKPLEGFFSMRSQEGHKRPDLTALGNPLSDMGHGAKRARLEATAKLFPSDDPEALFEDIRGAAKQLPNRGNDTEIAQARKALDEIGVERRKRQYQKTFDEVGLYARHAGWVAARAGNGDLLVARETPESIQFLEDANYRETHGGYGSYEGPTVPFNNTPESTSDVQWVRATGTEDGIS